MSIPGCQNCNHFFDAFGCLLVAGNPSAGWCRFFDERAFDDSLMDAMFPECRGDYADSED